MTMPGSVYTVFLNTSITAIASGLGITISVIAMRLFQEYLKPTE